jgi:hypothetical protein
MGALIWVKLMTRDKAMESLTAFGNVHDAYSHFPDAIRTLPFSRPEHCQQDTAWENLLASDMVAMFVTQELIRPSRLRIQDGDQQ